MPPKKRRASRKKVSGTARRIRNPHPRLPGYLLILFGFICLLINFDLIPGLEWAKPYPLLAVLFGFVQLIKTAISRD